MVNAPPDSQSKVPANKGIRSYTLHQPLEYSAISSKCNNRTFLFTLRLRNRNCSLIDINFGLTVEEDTPLQIVRKLVEADLIEKTEERAIYLAIRHLIEKSKDEAFCQKYVDFYLNPASMYLSETPEEVIFFGYARLFLRN